MELVKREYEILDDKMLEYGGIRIKKGVTTLKLTEPQARYGLDSGSLRLIPEVKEPRHPSRKSGKET